MEFQKQNQTDTQCHYNNNHQKQNYYGKRKNRPRNRKDYQRQN